MPNKDFEKKVQQQMQDLRFQPSEESWKRIQSGIEKKRGRRPIIFWLIFLGIISTGIIYYTNRVEKTGLATKSTPVHTSDENKNEAQNENKKEEITASTKASEPDIQKTSDKPGSTSTGSTNLSEERKKLVSNSDQNVLVAKENKTNQIQIVKTAKDQNRNSKKILIEKDEALITFENKNLETTNPVAEDITRKIAAAIPSYDRTKLTTNEIAVFGDDVHLDSNSNLIEAIVKPILQVDQDSGLITSSSQKILEKQKKISWALSMGMGISDLGIQLFQSTSVANYDAQTSQSTGSGTVVFAPSKAKAGTSFAVGGFAYKPLTKKLKLGIGLSYQYYSNLIRVGQRVDTSRLVNNGAFSLEKVDEFYTVAGTNQGNQYVSNQYTNKYHFLGAAVRLNWEITKNVSWENGLSYVYLLNTNALHFDRFTGTYYENKELFKRSQLLASTSLLYNFSKGRISLGPELQYGLSGLLKSDAQSTKHLRYVGLRAYYFLKK